jgi:hypothetical protein
MSGQFHALASLVKRIEPLTPTEQKVGVGLVLVVRSRILSSAARRTPVVQCIF